MIIAAIIGIALMAGLGLLGRRQSMDTHSGWSIGDRGMSSITTFFLQAGAIFTSFTFLGMSGLTILGGISATYLPAYLVLGYIGMFLIGPIVWKLGSVFDYHTNADMVGHQFKSNFLTKVVAIISVVFFMPIVQVQIVGLGTMVSFATGDKSVGIWSMIGSTVLILLFVAWAGLRGVSMTAYFKDVAMVVALVVILIGVIAHYGSNGGMSSAISEMESLFIIESGTKTYGTVWFITSVIVSGIGLGAMTLPESWPAVLAADSSKAVSKNHVMLPLYSLSTLIPILIGFYAVKNLSIEKGEENSAILSIAAESLPSWLMGFVLIAGISCAIVPAAHCVISIATLISSNLVSDSITSDRRLLVGKGASAAILLLSLLLAVSRPDLMANLYLLTYAGLVQLAPANILACTKTERVNAKGIMMGMFTGVLIVLAFTITGYTLWGMNSGIVAIVVNVLVIFVVSAMTGKVERPQLVEAKVRTPIRPISPGTPGTAVRVPKRF
ncbi:putative symporter YodF [Corynebacterium kalinowskii]|uniref:Symporter YodF n=1 Tax=Corynebacterium kalinowskii TaxID=2675216 RepID=A0A6B8VP10_9CORY|nr:sodium:solute symporter family protein [Corynebacterium kalinowskii]QGU01531.1 putative symporter YodF [Corynebacterium kalinowskii]